MTERILKQRTACKKRSCLALWARWRKCRMGSTPNRYFHKSKAAHLRERLRFMVPVAGTSTGFDPRTVTFINRKPLPFGERLRFMVPVAGVEPARYRYQRILNPPRLPIPTHRHITKEFYHNYCGFAIYISFFLEKRPDRLYTYIINHHGVQYEKNIHNGAAHASRRR